MASDAVRNFAASKRSLTALSHAMERSLEVGRDTGPTQMPPLLIGLFQRPEYFEAERDRYARIAADGALCIVGFAGPAHDMPPGVTAVSLDTAEALALEWALVVVDGALGTALVASDDHDLMDGETSLEVSRLFTARWSFSSADAAAEACRILGLMGARVEVSVRAAADAAILAARETTPSHTERRLAAVTQMLVTSIDSAQPLTGLHNRRYLSRFMSSPTLDSPVRLTALLVDLDGLKDINDVYGHTAGDAALVAAAQSLLQVTRPQDVVIRMGGDEFLLVLPGLDSTAGVQVGERILESLSSVRLPTPWDRVALSASIGVAMVPPHGLPLELLDAALYAGKRAGGNQVTFLDQVGAEGT